jgi:uncharacterized protein YbbK (DUF523 family)
MRLEGDAAAPRLVVIETGEDLRELMRRWAAARLAALRALGLHGYVLKARPPSCGRAVSVHTREGEPTATAPGLFAAALAEACPGLPIVEEDDLQNPAIRHAFLGQARRAASCR